MFVALIAICATLGILATVNLFTIQGGYAASQKEYAELRQYAPLEMTAAITATALPNPGEETAAIPAPSAEQEILPDLSAINPDYIGWIRIEGTEIDYPVVQGKDNKEYLNITFSGERNASGTIFMDNRCADGFRGFAILYGHNMKDGFMFAGLNRYLESGYPEEYPEIIVITLDGKPLNFRIFDVKVTNIRDAAYALPDKEKADIGEYFTGQGMHEETGILILSTCTDNRNENERLLVFAEKQ